MYPYSQRISGSDTRREPLQKVFPESPSHKVQDERL